MNVTKLDTGENCSVFSRSRDRREENRDIAGDGRRRGAGNFVCQLGKGSTWEGHI